MPNPIAWHATPAENLEAILSEGLLPRIGPRSADLGEDRPAIYLFPDLEAVEAGAASWLEEAFDPDLPLALLKIDLSGMAGLSASGFELICHAPVPADRISVASADLWAETAFDHLADDAPAL